MGGCIRKRDIPRFIAFCQRGKLPVQKLRTGTITLGEINEGSERLSDDSFRRRVLRPHG